MSHSITRVQSRGTQQWPRMGDVFNVHKPDIIQEPLGLPCSVNIQWEQIPKMTPGQMKDRQGISNRNNELTSQVFSAYSRVQKRHYSETGPILNTKEQRSEGEWPQSCPTVRVTELSISWPIWKPNLNEHPVNTIPSRDKRSLQHSNNQVQINLEEEYLPTHLTKTINSPQEPNQKEGNTKRLLISWASKTSPEGKLGKMGISYPYCWNSKPLSSVNTWPDSILTSSGEPGFSGRLKTWFYVL